ILERVGDMAYRLALPPRLSEVHNIFHVSTLRKYLADPSHVLSYEPLHLRKDLTFDEVPVRIFEIKEKELRNKKIKLVKVLWGYHAMEEATWEREDKIRARYPNLFGKL
ncbi:Chromo domain containing protein, partial [Trema orientale]